MLSNELEKRKQGIKKNYAYGKAVGIDSLRSHQEATRGRAMPTAKPSA